MTKPARQRLFYLSVIVFIFLSIGVLSFAFGLTYDFENNQIIKTGSISLNANTDGQIYLDGRLAGNTSLLGDTFSKRNLLPGKYTVEIRRDNYHSWSKTMEVRAELVTDFSKILLVSQQPSEDMIIGSVSAVFFSGHDRWMAFRRGEQLIIFDLYGQKENYRATLGALNQKKLKLVWSSNFEKILAHDGILATVFDTRSQAATVLPAVPAYFLNDQAAFDGSKIYNRRVQKEQKRLESFDINSGRVELVAEDSSLFYLFDDKLFFISDGDRRPYLLHLSSGRLEAFAALAGLSPVSFGAVSKVEDAHNKLYFLAGENLYTADQTESVLIRSGVRAFAISPDRYLMGWITDREVWTMGLRDKLYQPQRLVGEEERLWQSSDVLKDFAWHRDSAHLFLKGATSSPVLAEVDIRGGVNRHSLWEESEKESVWRYNGELNKVVRFSGGEIVFLSY